MTDVPYTIDDLKNICADENIIITKHTRKRFSERGITIEQVKHTIMTGEIIEEYPGDKPFARCLVCGKDTRGLFMHVVLSNDKRYIYVITAYYPDEQKWINGYKTRKRGNDNEVY